jgi:peroxidase
MKQPCSRSTTTIHFLLLLVISTASFPLFALAASDDFTRLDLAEPPQKNELAADDHAHVRRDLSSSQKNITFLGEVRPINGTGNHADNLGAVGTLLLRLAGVDYPTADPSGQTLLRPGPNPRDISNMVVHQNGTNIPSAAGMTDAVWAWGQFIDHDISLTDANRARNGAADVDVLDANDMLYPKIIVSRANHEMVDGVRTPFNELTSFLDASMVYGSDDARAAELRAFVDGKLKTSPGNLMPFNVNGFPNGGASPENFLSGDVRTNENVVLLSIHTLFVREHNRLATLLKKRHKNANDESLYQLARKIVMAEVQLITFCEFLPALLGPHAPSIQPAYDPNVSPAVAAEFSTALFRVGHTLLSSQLMIGKDPDHQETISLMNAFFKPKFVADKPENVGRILRGLAVQPCQEVDNMIVEDVRTFLFLPPPNPVGLDLAVLNIQRGREQGLPGYNRVRVAYGLPPATQWSDISSNLVVQAKLAAVYPSVDEVDTWVGGICEDHLPGANLGPLISAAIIDQFTRLRDGDRLFYTNDPDLRTPWIASFLKKVTFGRLIRMNTEETKAPLKMFFMPKTKA